MSLHTDTGATNSFHKLILFQLIGLHAGLLHLV